MFEEKALSMTQLQPIYVSFVAIPAVLKMLPFQGHVAC